MYKAIDKIGVIIDMNENTDHYMVSVESVIWDWWYHKDNLDKIETIPDELFKM